MANFFSRAGDFFKRQTAARVDVSKKVVNIHRAAVQSQLHLANRIAYYHTPRAASKSWQDIKDYSKRSVRDNAEGLAKFNTAITGIASFVVSLFPVVGTIAAQFITAAGYGQGRYLGGVEGRAEGRHGKEARDVGRMRGRQALYAGEGGATLGFLAVALAPAAAGAGTAAAQGGAASAATVGGAAGAGAEVGVVAGPTAGAAVAVDTGSVLPGVAATSATESAAVGAEVAGGSVFTLQNAGLVTGLLSTGYGIYSKLFPKIAQPNGGAQIPLGNPSGLGGAPGSDQTEQTDGGIFGKEGSKMVLALASVVGGVVLFNVIKKGKAA